MILPQSSLADDFETIWIDADGVGRGEACVRLRRAKTRESIRTVFGEGAGEAVDCRRSVRDLPGEPGFSRGEGEPGKRNESKIGSRLRRIGRAWEAMRFWSARDGLESC